MTIELNGDRIELRAGASVAELVERTGAGGDRRGVAVAVDGEVVPRSAWDETVVSDGQKSRSGGGDPGWVSAAREAGHARRAVLASLRIARRTSPPPAPGPIPALGSWEASGGPPGSSWAPAGSGR